MDKVLERAYEIIGELTVRHREYVELIEQYRVKVISLGSEKASYESSLIALRRDLERIIKHPAKSTKTELLDTLAWFDEDYPEITEKVSNV